MSELRRGATCLEGGREGGEGGREGREGGREGGEGREGGREGGRGREGGWVGGWVGWDAMGWIHPRSFRGWCASSHAELLFAAIGLCVHTHMEV